MRVEPNRLRLSATDLANHLACRHLTRLDLGAAEGRWTPPAWRRPDAEVLAERGREHERAFLDHLERHGLTITRLDEEEAASSAFERTIAAMRAGTPVIAQATLLHERWFGRADVLRRVERPSALGAWSYEPLDTKLARETKGGTILQLCLYAVLLEAIQELRPEHMHVVPRRPDFPLETHRVDDYLAYFRFVRQRLETAVEADASAVTYPEPVAHCEICRWWPRCDRERRDDDHLSLVAGISRLQTRELESREVGSLAGLAAVPLPIPWKPKRGAREGYARVREQARIQLAGRTANEHRHELLPLLPGLGLARLPEPAPGDLFLDLEADPYVDDGGIEYLFGWVVRDPPADGTLALEAGAPVYHRRWAFERTAERRGFERLIDAIMERLARDPDMHVYHFGVYEEGAVKRLMCRYGTREAEVDTLLRGERFVDLHAIVKQSLRASVEEYSIKKLEPFYGFQREQPLEEASAALRVLQRTLELGGAPAADDSHAATVEAYNREDCLSTVALREWLEALRARAIAEGAVIARPLPRGEAPSDDVRERERRAHELASRLLAGVPEQGRSEQEQALWLLAQLLDWHRREEKTAWWEFFRLSGMADDELLDDVAAIAGLTWVERLPSPPRSRAPIERYRFPAQETRIREKDKLHTGGPEPREFGDVVAIDPAALTVDVRKRLDRADDRPASVFAHEIYRTGAQFESLMRLGEWVAAHGIDAPGPHRAARDLLLRRPPRVAGHAGGPLERQDETIVDAARRIGPLLDHTTLVIQGPPGAGKTFTGAHMICDLVREGRRVGVCAQSHKVIAKLMTDALRAAEEEGLALRALRKVSDDPDPAAVIPETADNAAILAALAGGGADVAGGTAWLWAREDMFEAVDVLFVDEAGQMSLANVLAIAQSAKSVVLLGDPQQLEQPVQGSHPEGTDRSALEHVLGGARTIASERGLFLDETWRLHPLLCEFTSELFYEGRLRSHPGLERQALLGDTPFAGAGLWFVPVEHDANQSSSPEEVEVVAGLVEMLTRPGIAWRDARGDERPLTLDDLLVIAPYNAQVYDLGQRLPGIHAGTVDRFQGQQAPVVIYSLATSTPEDAPRGMDFLYDLNRFNVATSRARCTCIVVGNPRLLEPDCRTPGQMKMANAACRYLERARVVRAGSAVLAPLT